MTGTIRSAFVLFAAVILCACQGGDSHSSSPSLPVTTQNLTGNWEVVSVSANGVTVPANMTSAASEAGYQESYGKLQYRITDRTVQSISSDELSVTFAIESNYHLDHEKLITENQPGQTMPGFTIASLSTDSMTMTPDGPSQPAGLQFGLARIPDGELATNKLKPISQNLDFQIHIPSGDLSDTMAASYPTNFVVGEGRAISCTFRKGKSPSLQIHSYGYRLSPSGQLSTGGMTCRA